MKIKLPTHADHTSDTLDSDRHGTTMYRAAVALLALVRLPLRVRLTGVAAHEIVSHDDGQGPCSPPRPAGPSC